MVPQHTNTPGEPPRSFSPDVQLQLETAMRAYADEPAASEKVLKDALTAAANDGRERGLRPEELVVALKQVEARIQGLTERGDNERSALRLRMLRALFDAYYRS